MQYIHVNSLPQEQKRKTFYNNALVQARALADKSLLGNARAIADFLEQETTLACPGISGSILHLGNAEPVEQTGYYFVPCIWADGLSNTTFWVQYFSANTMSEDYAACYDSADRAIYMSAEWQLSPLVLGLLVLHEGQHAIVYANGTAKDDRAEREVAAIDLEASVAFAALGPLWLQFIEGVDKRWLDRAPGTDPAYDKLILDAAATHLGPCLSEVDRGSRLRLIKVCARRR